MYEGMLFVHVTGAVLLFMAMAVELFAGARLRRAETVEEARTLLPLTLMIEPLFPIATLLLLGTGFYMGSQEWRLSDGWIVVAVVTLVVFAALGPNIQGRRLKNVRDLLEAAPGGPLSAEQRRAIADPVTWGSMHGMSAGAFGILWLMTTKPSAVEAVAVVVALSVAGVVAGSAGARRAVQPAGAAG